MNYKSIASLSSDVKKWIPELPGDLDLIVGVPRSGLFVANLLSLYMNLPLTDIEGLCEGRIIEAGIRCQAKIDLSRKHKVLIVDDSVATGNQMQKIKKQIENNKLLHQIYYAAVYIVPRGSKYVDYWYEIVNLPRIFEWNVMHHGILSASCVDLDGVLCLDPTEKENDDSKNYQQFLASVKPLIIPSRTIGWFVTCRLEKYRDITEEWLKKHGIKYNNLVMMNLPNKDARIASGDHALFKAEFYKKVNAELFIESSYKQAREIATIAGKPVLCIETEEMIHPNYLIENFHQTKIFIKNRGKKFIKQAMHNPFRAFLKLIRFLRQKS